MKRKIARLVHLDFLYVKWLELAHLLKKHCYDRDFKTFGEYCEDFKRKGWRII